MKRKFSRTNPTDPPAIRSSKNQFKAAKSDEAKTSEYAFFRKLKTDASHASHSRPPHPFKLRDRPRERSSGVISSAKELRLPVEDVTRDVFLSPVDLNRASTTFGDICGTSTRRSMVEYNRTMRLKGTQTERQDLFSMKRQKLRQLVADISFPGIEELCSKGYDFVSVLLSRLFPKSNEDNSFKIPSSAQVLSDAKYKFLASPSSNIDSKDLHQTSTTTRNFMDVAWDPYLDNYSSVCSLGRSSKRTISKLDPLTGHAYNALPEFNSTEPSYELERERNAIAWTESGSTFSFPFENYGYCPSSYLSKLDDLDYPDASSLQRKEHALPLGWDSENVTNGRPSVISQNTELIPYPLASWGDSHEGSQDGFGGSRLCASSFICKRPSSFYSLPPPELNNYYRDEFRRHYIEDKEDIAADMDHCTADLDHRPFILSHRECFGRHYIEDEEKIAAGFNHSTLTLSHRPSYLSLTEGSDQETTSNASMSLLSPGDHHWFVSKFPTERHYDHKTESLLSSKPDFGLGRKCLSICDSSSKEYASFYPAIEFPGKELVSSYLHNVDEYENCLDSLSHKGVPDDFSNDLVNVQDWSSFYFQIFMERKRACSQLLDKSSWEASEGETHHANSEAKYI